jgi:probable addiction module antidote protein
MSKPVTALDLSEFLESEAVISDYLSEIVEENDPNLLIKAIGHIAKARGMSKIAKDSGLGRESLYKALSEDSHPRFDTILKVLNAMNIKISFAPAKSNSKPRSTVSKKTKTKLQHN